MADTVHKVLILTSTDPTGSGIGALFLRDLIATLPQTEFFFVYESPFLLTSKSRRRAWAMRMCRSVVVRIGWLQAMRLWIFRRFFLRGRVNAVDDRARQENADCFWVTASSPEIIWIGERLSARGHDVRVTVWDTPEYITENLRLPASARRGLMEGFGRLMTQATTASVVSEAMQQAYSKDFGIQAEIIRHGIDADPPPVHKSSGDGIRVVFAGSLYSKAEWNSFVSALASTGWQIGGRAVTLSFIGQFPVAGALRPKEVVFLGQLPFEAALETMADMDIGYLPYWFAQSYETVARTSFPGKLSAYAVAGLAVFHHAPSYTEVTHFLGKYPFGLSCATLKADSILRSLESLVGLMDTGVCREARANALRDELSQSAMSLRFQRFLIRKIHHALAAER